MVITVSTQVMTSLMELLYGLCKILIPVKPPGEKEGSFYIFIFESLVDIVTSFREFITGKNQRDLFFV